MSLSLHLHQQSSDGTQKFLWKLADGETVESVIIPRETPKGIRNTACISSQVGCAMACGFCLTGKQGLTRNLTTSEIVGQILALRERATIHNIVFMGMGEPLHNYDNVLGALKVFMDPKGLAYSRRRILVSTSGIVPAIEKLGREAGGVGLAISLNASQNASRTDVMPINKKWPIEELLNACRKYPADSTRPITFEYVMLSGVNDSLADASRVLQLLHDLPHRKVNLIPLNPHFGSEYQRPSQETVKAFQHYLVSRGMPTTVRQSRGDDISAACGQLKSAG